MAELRRLIGLKRLSNRRGIFAEKEINGDPHWANRDTSNKAVNAALWAKDRAAVEEQLKQRAAENGLTVSYPGLYPVFTCKNGREIFVDNITRY
jgi:hypothetical protein